jgi:hypothetical protein
MRLWRWIRSLFDKPAPVRREVPAVGRFNVIHERTVLYRGDSGAQARRVYEQAPAAEFWDRHVCRGRK